MKRTFLIFMFCITTLAFGWDKLKVKSVQQESPQSKLCHAVKTHDIAAARELLRSYENIIQNGHVIAPIFPVLESINLPADDGEPALHWAAALGDLDMVNLLLDNFASPTLGDLNGDTPLHSAVIGGNVAVVKTLLERGARETINTKNKWQQTPLSRSYLTSFNGIILSPALSWRHSDTELQKLLKDNGAREDIRPRQPPIMY